MATITVVNIMRCRKCDVVHGRVVTLSCGHHYCLTCLEDQHDDWTEGCKQPCQACFKLSVPKKSDLNSLSAKAVDIPNMSNLDTGNNDSMG